MLGGETHVGTVSPEEAQQRVHAMLLEQPPWPVLLDCGLNSSRKLFTDTFLCLGSFRSTVEHAWHMKNTCWLLQSIQEYV